MAAKEGPVQRNGHWARPAGRSRARLWEWLLPGLNTSHGVTLYGNVANAASMGKNMGSCSDTQCSLYRRKRPDKVEGVIVQCAPTYRLTKKPCSFVTRSA